MFCTLSGRTSFGSKPWTRACGQKSGRCPLSQKAAGRRRGNCSSVAESFPPHSQLLAKLLTSAPIDFYLCAAEIGIEVLHRVRRFLLLVVWRTRRLELHRDMRIPAVAQLVCEEAKENQEIPVPQSVAEEEERASQRTIDSMRD